MDKIVLSLHIAVSIFLIGTVLLQAGKGASIGASFGGSNQPMYGSSQGSFMGKLTAGAAIVFMFTSLTLAYFSAGSSSSSIMSDLASPSAEMVQEDAAAQAEADKAFEDIAAEAEKGK
ncbi:MAG: preprotein translocase subunit SecG [Proteobacteria bacterium]|nr:preprotein translocase subunit SecG [Pseudomonadota bacterium]